MRRTLKDDGLETQFQKEGYVVIPFLSENEVKTLTDYYFETKNNSGGKLGPEDEGHNSDTELTYDFTFIDKNIQYKEQVFDMITKAFISNYEKYLLDYKPIIANYIHKKTDGGEVPMHQNWAFVDEENYASVSIWCPLVDSSKKNGTLEVVPASHKRFGKVRGPMIQSELFNIDKDIIEHCMKPIDIKAGHAVILDDSIVHYSSPNYTDGLRLAIQLILIPNEVNSIHYHMDLAKDRNRVEVLEVDKDFYTHFNPWKKPSKDIKRIRSFAYTPFSIDFETFKKELVKPRFDMKNQGTWWKRFTSKLMNS